MDKRIIFIYLFLFLFSINSRSQKLSDTKDKAYVLELINTAASIRGENPTEQSKQEAEEYLLSTFENSSEHSKSVRSIINYTLGYYNHQDAVATKFSNDEYLRKAEKYYISFLSDYPENEKVLLNLQIVQKYLGRGERLAETTNRLIEFDPENKQQHERYYGDILKERGNLDEACTQYRNAFSTDSWDEANCRRIVNMYNQHSLICLSEMQLEEFAYHCAEAGYPYLSIEVLEKKLKNELSTGAQREANETFVHWVNVLAENGWLSEQRIDNMQYFIKDEFKPFSELKSIIKGGNPESWPGANFWIANEEYYNSEKSGRVTPMIVLAKIYFSRAKEFRKRQNPKATAFTLELSMKWIQRYIREYNEFPPLFFPVSIELAKTYYKYKEVDSDGNKLNNLERKLFEGKADAYSSGNNKVIREYHTTLGLIYYDQERWKSKGFASNAKFQLKRALDPRFGPIINPKLREMLGEVHFKLNEKSVAADSYIEAGKDYLRLDKIEKAISTIEMTNEMVGSNQNYRSKRMLRTLSLLAADRQAWQSKSHPVLTSSGDQFIQEMNQIEQKEVAYANDLGKEFVSTQVFKGLSDLAKNTSDNRANYQQFLYATALTKIERSDNLNNLADNSRISDIRKSLDQSIRPPTGTPSKSQIAMIPFKRVTTIREWRRGSEDKKDAALYKSYKVEGQEAILQVPVTMFDFSRIISQFYIQDKMEASMPQYEVTKSAAIDGTIQFRKIEG